MAIDALVRHRALAQAKAWADSGAPLRMAINLSTRDLRNPDLASELGALIEETGVSPELVELEITDRVVMHGDDLSEVVTRLHGLGTRLAIDDFGTGNSVLARLHHCPVDVLKIDRSFISELGHNDADGRLVRALDLARACARAACGRRGHRDRGPSGPAPPVRLRPRPGLPVQPAGGRRRHRGAGRGNQQDAHRFAKQSNTDLRVSVARRGVPTRRSHACKADHR